jgi:hypothetical protein
MRVRHEREEARERDNEGNGNQTIDKTEVEKTRGLQYAYFNNFQASTSRGFPLSL